MFRGFNYLESFSLLNKIHPKYKIYKYYILKGFVTLILKKYEYSLHLMDKGLFLVVDNNKLNEDEKKYLSRYVYSSMLMAYRMVDKLEEAKKFENLIKNLNFSIENVNEKIRYLFPQNDYLED